MFPRLLLLISSFFVSAPEVFAPYPSPWLYNFYARRLALSKVDGLTTITFPWIGGVNPQIKCLTFFPSEVIIPRHKSASSLNTAMYVSMSEFCTVRFHNSCSSFCNSPQGQYSSSIIVLRSSHNMEFAIERVRALMWLFHHENALSSKVHAANFTLLSSRQT